MEEPAVDKEDMMLEKDKFALCVHTDCFWKFIKGCRTCIY